MAQAVAPADLRNVLRHTFARKGAPTALVEYFHMQRDPAVARAVNRAASWLRRHGHAQVTVLCVDLAQDADGQLDRMRVKVLPQPTTVALYRQHGQRTQLWAGRATSASALVTEALR
mgnify:CR=1 FL=1